MNTNNNTTKRVLPIRFKRLRVGSKFRIFAEPSREIQKSTDQTVYIKDAESYSTDVTNVEHVAILYPEDLVIPLTRGNAGE